MKFYYSQEQNRRLISTSSYYKGILTPCGWVQYTNTGKKEMSDNKFVYESDEPILVSKTVFGEKDEQIYEVTKNNEKLLIIYADTKYQAEQQLREKTQILTEEYFPSTTAGGTGAV